MPNWFWKKNTEQVDAPKNKIPTVDVSGPEYHNLFPSKERIVEILGEDEVFRAESLNKIAEVALENRNIGGRGIATKISRFGRLLSAEELRDSGLRANRKIGKEFVEMIASQNIDYAIKFLESRLLFAFAEANMLFDLGRHEKLGLLYVRLSSPKDERNTDIENQFDGKKLTIQEAKALVKNHGREITRSVFLAEIPSDFLK
jgi:hypothetical protein